MSFYVIHDLASGMFYDQVFGKLVPLNKAKRYKRLSAALSGSTGAGLMNVTGQKVVVQEYDDNANYVATHLAPPWLIHL